MPGRKLIVGQEDLDRMGNEINEAFAKAIARIEALEEAVEALKAPKKVTTTKKAA